MATDFEKSVDKYADSIKFICPKEIASENANKAYNNLRANKPEKSSNKNKNDTSSSGIDSLSPGFYSDKNKGSKGLLSDADKKLEKNKEIIRFGQHSSFSFFESYTREIIFQIFDYHPMYFFNYEIKTNELIENNIKESGKDKTQNSEHPDALNDTKKKDVEIKDDNQSKGKDNIDKNNLMNSKGEEEEDKKIEMNISKLGNEVENPNDEKSKEDKNIINKINLNKIENKKEKLNKINKKEKNLTSGDSIKIKNNNNSNKVEMKGDIDFMIPDLKGEELKQILTKKELAPFLFYDKINLELNSDLIGEIKENFSTGDEKHIAQFNKYLKIIKLSNKRENIRKKFGFKKENQKIIVYIFDGSYKDYLKRMLIHKALFKKFETLNNSEKAKEILEIHSKKYKKEPNWLIKKDFIKTVLDSDTPYIFIFIQDLLSTFLLEKKSNENKSKSEDIKEDNIHKGINKRKRKKGISQKVGDMNEKLDQILKKLDYLLFLLGILIIILIIVILFK